MDDKGSGGKTNKTAVHAIGSSDSYACRYLKKMAFNVPSGKDDDGNAAGGHYDTANPEALEQWMIRLQDCSEGTVAEISQWWNKYGKQVQSELSKADASKVYKAFQATLKAAK